MVLQPQRLADVLARVFTARLHDGDLRDGILKHGEETLAQVWGFDSELGAEKKWSDRMWRWSVDPSAPDGTTILSIAVLFIVRSDFGQFFWIGNSRFGVSPPIAAAPAVNTAAAEKPPFLDLLHTSGLAFELFNNEGNSLQCSLIPAKLPPTPPKMTATEAQELLDDDPVVFIQLLAHRH